MGPDLAQVLSDLEDRELPLLNWGVVDGVLSHAEVREVVARRLGADEHADDVDDVIDELLDLALVIDVPDRPGFRTRFAETIRLAALNRQLFGRGAGAWWSGGAGLVSDFRLDVRTRSYPRRDLTRTELAADVASAGVPIAAEQEPVLAALTASAAQLSRFPVDATREILASLAREKTSGVIVSAGTGSGKTLAFYLPAMLWLSERVAKGDYRTHTLALYPRKELLKDQVAEALRAASQAPKPYGAEAVETCG